MIRTTTEAAPAKGGIQGLAKKRVDIFMLDPHELRIEVGWNSRLSDFDPTDEDDLALARSISEVGVKNPLTVHWKNDAPFITDGHRRFGAIMHAIAAGAEILTVPVRTEDRYSSEADRVLSQIVRNSGKPLTPIEQARVFKKLIDLGWDEKTIATKVGLSRQRVVDLLTLQAGPTEVVAMVEAGEVSATLAAQTMKAARGDAVAATERLRTGVERAKAAGKDRATARHVVKPRPGAGVVHGLRIAAEIVREGLTEGKGLDDVLALIEAAADGRPV